ncbi:MAG: SusD/RagB family nutrient-binding outer membrane lipoprotein, partial [Bacteroidota bacterium]|nr:SusD/RagB family nutrient-binding outer membrane lipoprotein [Bacteroidota bacterium]
IDIDNHITPKYDAQKDVYHSLLNDLKTAAGLIDPSGKAIKGDVLYSGNLNKWIKFANSLRYRIALRIADREPELAQSVISEIPKDKLIGDGETAQLNYLASPNQNPIALFFETRDDYRVSKSIVETLRSLNDPRLPVFANKTETATPQGYVGVPNGLTTTDASNLGFSKTSKLGTYFTTAQTPAVILTTAEVLFDRAEAAARGFSSEDPQNLYNQAITASFKQFGITDAATISAYLAQSGVAYDASNFRKSIGNQKWIALFGQGLEAFAEWRRLDYPQLTPAVAGVLNGKFPLRYIYPGSEQSLNLKSYQAAVAHQGADALTTKLWFDVY